MTFQGYYDLGRIVNVSGTGVAPLDLGNAYTPGTQTTTNSGGKGSARVSIVLAGGGATKVYLRLMDYTNPAKPRALQWTRMDTNVTANEHTFMASIDLDFEWSFGRVVPVFAIEKKCDGAAVAGDTVTADADLSEAF